MINPHGITPKEILELYNNVGSGLDRFHAILSYAGFSDTETRFMAELLNEAYEEFTRGFDD